MRAMILCAGMSTRLGALGAALPKPLLPVCGIPILRYGLALLTAHGIRDVVINLHHRGDLIRDELGDGAALGARIRYVEEPVILGTGGGLKNALHLLDPDGQDEPFLSMNGKLIFDLDLAALLAARERDPDVLGTFVVRRVPDATDWGAVDVVPAGTVADPGRARVRDVLGQGQHMFCGVHITRPSVVRRLPDGEACMIRQGYLPWMHAGGAVAAFDAGNVYFAEHSIPERYLDSNLALLGGAVLRHPPGPLRGVDPTAEIAPGARVVEPVRVAAGARIGAGAVVGPGAVIGAGAVVAPGVTVDRSVVWPGVVVGAPLSRAIATEQGPVPA